MTKQITDTLLMVRPVAFGANDETAVNNYYQKTLDISFQQIQKKATDEFDRLVDVLRSEGVEVIVVEDTADPETPDSIFPNNWVSFHEDGSAWTYPMFAKSRRLERRDDIFEKIAETHVLNKRGSFAEWEKQGKYLEGTGSLILDRIHKIGYAALSDRTHPDVLKEFTGKTGYEIVSFHSYQTVYGKRLPIYHTNVMMFVGEGVALICLDSIDDREERNEVVKKLEDSGKEIIGISEKQTEHFAGNMLQVATKSAERLIVMSQSAYNCLETSQKEILSKHGKLIYSDLTTIETLGGGSARCMMAEVFLPRKS